MTKTLVAAGAAMVLAGATAAPTLAAPAARSDLPPLNKAALAAAMSGLPKTVTGALVKVSGSAGNWAGTSGAGNTETGTPVPAYGHFRIGSVSKVFTAVVVLQLAAEHRIDLDQSVGHYLPELLPKKYKKVTVRQLLNHTSGLPEWDLPHGDAQWFVDHRFDSWTPKQVVDSATKTGGWSSRRAPGSTTTAPTTSSPGCSSRR